MPRIRFDQLLLRHSLRHWRALAGAFALATVWREQNEVAEGVPQS